MAILLVKIILRLEFQVLGFVSDLFQVTLLSIIIYSQQNTEMLKSLCVVDVTKSFAWLIAG